MTNPLLTKYVPILDVLEPTAGHGSSEILCAMDALVLLQSDPSRVERLPIEGSNPNKDTCGGSVSDAFVDDALEGLTTEMFEGIQLNLVGLDAAFNQGAFEVLTASYIEEFYKDNPGLGVSNVKAKVEIVDVSTERRLQTIDDNHRSLQEKVTTVTFDLTLSYASDGSDGGNGDGGGGGATSTTPVLTPAEVVMTPFASDEAKNAYVTTLIDEDTSGSFSTLKGVAALELPPTPAPTSSPRKSSAGRTSTSALSWRLLMLASAAAAVITESI